MLKKPSQVTVAAAQRPSPGRPRKLTRAEIVDGAIALVEKQGPRALTMRALGKNLGVQASTFYNYFGSVGQLNQEIGVKLLSAVPLPGSIEGVDARGQLVEHLMALRAVLARHPGIADYSPGSAWGAWGLHKFEAELKLLEQAGVDQDASIVALRVLNALCAANAQTVRVWDSGDAVSRRKRVRNAVDAAQFPRVAAIYDKLTAILPSDQAFRDMLEKLIDGLLPQLAPRRRKPS